MMFTMRSRSLLASCCTVQGRLLQAGIVAKEAVLSASRHGVQNTECTQRPTGYWILLTTAPSRTLRGFLCVQLQTEFELSRTVLGTHHDVIIYPAAVPYEPSPSNQ